MKYLFALLVTIGILVVPHEASAQTGDCAAAEADAYLDVGNVRARVFNNGALFYRSDLGQGIYEVPKDGQTQAIYAASLLIAGLVDNELHAAASRLETRNSGLDQSMTLECRLLIALCTIKSGNSSLGY